MTFEHAKYNDNTVNKMLTAGCTLEEIIGQLASEKQQYVARIIELESIAPKKFKLPNGQTMIWQCPDELVPV